MRREIRAEVERIDPLDALEETSKRGVLEWIDSGAELCRLEKPAVPPKHLVSYVVVADNDHVLLVDHINAGLWLPCGGHVEPREHPRSAAVREVAEELGFHGELKQDGPWFLTVTQTVGKTAGHTDVSLWYVMHRDRAATLEIDDSEFRAARWYHLDDIPLDRSDPQMARFIRKYSRKFE